MSIELLSQLTDILSCVFSFVALVGIGIVTYQLNKLTIKGNIYILNSNVAGDIKMDNKFSESVEN